MSGGSTLGRNRPQSPNPDTTLCNDPLGLHDEAVQVVCVILVGNKAPVLTIFHETEQEDDTSHPLALISVM